MPLHEVFGFIPSLTPILIKTSTIKKLSFDRKSSGAITYIDAMNMEWKEYDSSRFGVRTNEE